MFNSFVFLERFCGAGEWGSCIVNVLLFMQIALYHDFPFLSETIIVLGVLEIQSNNHIDADYSTERSRFCCLWS